MTPETLAEIHAECFEGAPRPWSRDEFAALLADQKVTVTTLSEGFAVTRIAGDEAELLTIAVRPAAQGTGIGTQLMALVCAGVAEAGASAMFLEVAQDNAKACALYGASGFQEVGLRKDYYASARGQKISAVVMKLTF